LRTFIWYIKIFRVNNVLKYYYVVGFCNAIYNMEYSYRNLFIFSTSRFVSNVRGRMIQLIFLRSSYDCQISSQQIIIASFVSENSHMMFYEWKQNLYVAIQTCWQHCLNCLKFLIFLSSYGFQAHSDQDVKRFISCLLMW
jgi:hypothetical protein